MRKKSKLVQGIGTNDSDEPVKINGGHIKSYHCWLGMLERCYSIKCQSKHPTYIGCSVCEEWKYFSNFKKWYDVNYRDGFELDKDILIDGNKVYAPEFCRFVPQNINKLLTDSHASRGDLPLGITCKTSIIRGKTYQYYEARCCNGQGTRISKTFKTMNEAVAWYSLTKTRIVQEVATRALDAGLIQSDIYNALIARTF